MNRNWQNFSGFIFIPLVFGLAGGIIGGAIGGGAILGIGLAPMLGLTGTQMGAMLGMMAGSTLGNLLFPTKHETHWPEIGNYPIQKSIKGPPLQKILGTLKVSGNITWEGDIHPYQIKHSAGGGKGGGAEAVSYETRYRQSFLIDLGEGPASVLRIWADNKQIWPNVSGGEDPNITIFEGIDNNGIKDLTGEDYGEWPHNCCVFFNEYDLGGNQIKPNFTFEVSSCNTEYFIGYFIGYYYGSGSDKNILYKLKSDNTIDTSWGDNGAWHYDSGYGSTLACYDVYPMPDGRTLVLHNNFWIEESGWPDDGKLCACTMLTKTGSIDTSWGYNGHYIISRLAWQYPFVNGVKLMRDRNGDFYLFASSNTGSPYSIHKFDSDGTRIYAREWTEGPYNARCQTFYDACWYDDSQERIIAVGSAQNSPGGGIFNCMALDPETGDADTGWIGNISGEPGYASIKAMGTALTAYQVERLSDGSFVIFVTPTDSPSTDKSLCRISSDGSEYKNSFGTNGWLEAGKPNNSYKGLIADGHSIWTLASKRVNGTDDHKIQWWRRYDESGNLIDSHDFDSPVAIYNYRQMILVMGNAVFATDDQSPAVHDIEFWSKNQNYVDGFETPDSGNKINMIHPLIRTRNTLDANFATMCKEVLTDSQWGAGFDSSLLNEASFNAIEDYCGSQGLLGSIVIGQQKSWRDWLDYICSHFGGYYFESGGQICLGVYKDEDAVFNLTLANNDFVIDEGENPPPPIAVKERDESETFNQIKVVWTDRDNDYDIGGPAVAADETNQRWSGQIREKIYDLAGITDAQLAQRMAYQLLIEAMYRFKIYSFTVTYKNMLLEVGDVGTIDDGDQINQQKVRIIKIDEDMNGRGLAITAVEDIAELYPEIIFATQESLRKAPEPIDLEDAVINFREDVNVNSLYLSIKPGSAFANGWYIYRSYDDVSYELIGRCGIDGITGGDANSSGTIQSSLPAHPTMTWAPDESFLVDIGTVTDLRTDVTEAEFWSDRNCLIRIGDEILAYRDADETETPGIWQVSFLRRGLFGTEVAAHSSGANFCTLDPDFAYKFNESDIGQTLYFKAATFYGDDVQNIANLSGFSVKIHGYYQRPATASLLRLTADQSDGPGPRNGDYIQYSGPSFTLYWDLGSRISGYGYGGYGDVPYGNYTADDDLQKITLKFEEEDSTPIGEREIDVASQSTITKATDLGGYNPARIKVVPRRVLGSRLENSILVDDGS